MLEGAMLPPANTKRKPPLAGIDTVEGIALRMLEGGIDVHARLLKQTT